MEGLNKILQKIEDENNIQAEKILSDGKIVAENICKQAEEEATEDAKKIIAQAEKSANQIIENAQSGSEAYIKRQELDAKTKVIYDLIDKASKALKQMDHQTYFDIIEKLVVKYHHQGDGVLCFNSNDLDKLPKDFAEKINSQITDGKITVSAEKADIEKGFVLKYDGIEENCSFDALIQEKKDEIKDKIYEIITHRRA